jgi:single-stranded-DNA-specific exonuclease
MHSQWEILPGKEQTEKQLVQRLGVSPLLARLLYNRGLHTAEEARRFLEPSLGDISDPFRLAGMEQAVERLIAAWRRREKIILYGDYDVDGTSATAMMQLFFQALGWPVECYIPSRLNEGYGLHPAAIEQIAARGFTLLVALDCGVSDLEAIECARRLGLEVIVVDHHQPGEVLPAACAIIDPRQPHCGLRDQEPAAVGVAFYLLMALRSRLRSLGVFTGENQPNLRHFLDLVALGTVADMVPLTGDNRIFVKFGLEELERPRRKGLAALKEAAGLGPGRLSAIQLAFRLAPRLNAAGRMGEAERAVRLLATDSYREALELARELDGANRERQSLVESMLRQALDDARLQRESEEPALVLWREGWHPGVAGIVAAKLVENFGCPAAVIALEGHTGKGSVRAPEGVHVHQALVSCAEHLLALGGHRSAGGLKISSDHLADFRRSFCQAVAKQLGGQPPKRLLRLDAEIPLSRWSRNAVEELERLAPHGLSNPEPLFLARAVTVESARPVGNGSTKHLKLALIEKETVYDAIAFDQGDRYGKLASRMDLAYTPFIDDWNGAGAIRFRIREMRFPKEE